MFHTKWSLNMTNWFVSYKVTSLPNVVAVISGPYETEMTAYSHMEDISGYEGVTECLIYSENADELLDKSLA